MDTVTIPTFIRINRLKWIGHVNRMDTDRRPKSIFINYTEENKPRDRLGNC